MANFLTVRVDRTICRHFEASRRPSGARGPPRTGRITVAPVRFNSTRRGALDRRHRARLLLPVEPHPVLGVLRLVAERLRPDPRRHPPDPARRHLQTTLERRGSDLLRAPRHGVVATARSSACGSSWSTSRWPSSPSRSRLTVDARTVAQGVMLGAVLYVLASVWAFEVGLPAAIMSVASGEFPAGIGMNRNILSYTIVLALPFAVAFVPRSWRRACPLGCRSRALLWGVHLSESDTGLVASSGAVRRSRGAGVARPRRRRDAEPRATRQPARRLAPRVRSCSRASRSCSRAARTPP